MVAVAGGCGHEVEKKKMKQWFFKITDYADELLDSIDEVEWPEKIKIMQKNWIGRSTGAEISFEIDGGPRFVGEPPREGKKNTKRRTIQAFVYDPNTDKYLAISYKKMSCIAPVIGGIEGDEDVETAARREIREETGYKNLEFKGILGPYRAVFMLSIKMLTAMLKLRKFILSFRITNVMKCRRKRRRFRIRSGSHVKNWLVLMMKE